MNIVVGQSGGPTTVINHSLYGVLDQALKQPEIGTVYGMINGIEGLIQNRLVPLNDKLDLIRQATAQPGALLKSSRHELTEQDMETIVNRMEALKIHLFCYIGGNGSSRTVLALDRYARASGKDLAFMHIPKTIDNDLIGTDHTPGYGSAAKFLSQQIQWVAHDLKSMDTYEKVRVVEVMGKDVGWLSAASAIGKQSKLDPPQLVYLPGRAIPAEQIFSDVKQVYKTCGTVLLVVPDFLQVTGDGLLPDQLNASMPNILKGSPGRIGHYLAALITRQTGISTRFDAPGTLYRSAMCSVSRIDAGEAYQLGATCVRFLLEGRSGEMAALYRESGTPYACTIRSVDLDGIAGDNKPFPVDFWDEGRHMPTPSFREYLLPLIDHELPVMIPTLGDDHRRR